jgi:2,5-diketo-D-gluconate reductase B
MQTENFSDGTKIPVLGLGTYKLRGLDCLEAVKNAIDIGYRHIDTASIYGNEEQVGQAIKDSGIKREDLFLTSKLWITDFDNVVKACEESLQKLRTTYLDLYLVHWPNEDVLIEDIMRSMNDLVKKGKVKNIGVSNFSPKLFEEAQKYSKFPLVNIQVECHPLFQQKKLINYCQEKKLVLTAYSPIGQGVCLKHPLIIELSKKYSVSAAQICLRWLLDTKKVVVIPKATSIKHLKENLAVLDLKLDRSDYEEICNIQEQERIVNPGFAKWDEWE